MDSQNEHLSPLKDQNRFKQQFSYPPTEKDKETYNKINTTENMFACGRMIPTGHRDEKCECGHTFSQLVIESNKPVIHHSRPTYDSRDGPLSTYMLTTENCEHVKGGIQKKKGLKYLSLKQSSLRTPTHTHSTLLCYVSFFYWVEKYSTGWWSPIEADVDHQKWRSWGKIWPILVRFIGQKAHVSMDLKKWFLLDHILTFL